MQREIFYILFLICFLLPSVLYGAPVYKWTGDDGITHYSNVPPNSKAKPAELPEIMRGEVKLAHKNLKSCNTNGGINCQAGPDEDGSVICYDGTKDSSERYRFSCSAAKLEVADISDLSEKGTFSVFVRNTKSVAAHRPKVALKVDKKQIPLSGPEEIDPFGVAEFTYDSTEEHKLAERPVGKELLLSCINCP